MRLIGIWLITACTWIQGCSVDSGSQFGASSDSLTASKTPLVYGDYTCYGPSYWVGDPVRPSLQIPFSYRDTSGYDRAILRSASEVGPWVNPEAFLLAIRNDTYCYLTADVESFEETNGKGSFVPGESPATYTDIHTITFSTNMLSGADYAPSDCSYFSSQKSCWVARDPSTCQENACPSNTVRRVDPSGGMAELQSTLHGVGSAIGIGIANIQARVDTSEFVSHNFLGSCVKKRFSDNKKAFSESGFEDNLDDPQYTGALGSMSVLAFTETGGSLYTSSSVEVGVHFRASVPAYETDSPCEFVNLEVASTVMGERLVLLERESQLSSATLPVRMTWDPLRGFSAEATRQDLEYFNNNKPVGRVSVEPLSSWKALPWPEQMAAWWKGEISDPWDHPSIVVDGDGPSIPPPDEQSDEPLPECNIDSCASGACMTQCRACLGELNAPGEKIDGSCVRLCQPVEADACTNNMQRICGEATSESTCGTFFNYSSVAECLAENPPTECT